MSDNTYIPGQVVSLSMTSVDAGGIASDPGAVRLRIKPPTGPTSLLTYGVGQQIVRDGAGRYRAEVLLSAAGQWAWRWELDAPNAGAAEGVITVQRSRVI